MAGGKDNVHCIIAKVFFEHCFVRKKGTVFLLIPAVVEVDNRQQLLWQACVPCQDNLLGHNLTDIWCEALLQVLKHFHVTCFATRQAWTWHYLVSLSCKQHVVAHDHAWTGCGTAVNGHKCFSGDCYDRHRDRHADRHRCSIRPCHLLQAWGAKGLHMSHALCSSKKLCLNQIVSTLAVPCSALQHHNKT